MAVRSMKAIGWALCAALLPAVITARPAAAIGADWGGRASAMASNNIRRDQPGLEEDGYLLTLGFTVDVTQTKGRSSMRLSIYGGQENLHGETSSTEEVYRLLLEVAQPWADTGLLTLSAETSQQTETPEAGSVLQTRSETTRSRADLVMDGRSSPRTSWQARAGASEELRSDRESAEWTSGLSWSRDLTRTVTLSLDGGLGRGEDDFDGSSWQTSSARVDLARRIQQSGTSGFRLEWERSEVDEADGTASHTDRIGVGFFFRAQGQSGWSHRGNLGLDSIRPSEGESTLEPRADIGTEGPVTRRTQASLGLSYAARLQDPGQVDSAWINEGRLQAALRWDASRNVSVSPSVSYMMADYSGTGTTERVDEAVTAALGVTLRHSASWNTAVFASAESRDSTEETYRLEEGRLELTVSGQFL